MTDQTTTSEWRDMHMCAEGVQLFVIGDIHGQASALSSVLSCIADTPRCAPLRQLVFLGDIIDRGPQSLQSISLAQEARQLARVDEVTILPGNHELMLLDALDDPMMFMGDWLDNGGDALIGEAAPEQKVRLLADFAQIAHKAVPASFLSEMRNGPTSLLVGSLLLVHAGLDPQSDARVFLAQPRLGAVGGDHWAWIREPFLSWQGGWGPEARWTVIHGHTPAVRQPVTIAEFTLAADHFDTHKRICLDAGAATGLSQVAWAEFRECRYRLGLAASR